MAVSIKRLYSGMYLFSNGSREIRVARQDEAAPSGRWWITEDALFSQALIDATRTYAEARECAIAVLEEA